MTEELETGSTPADDGVDDLGVPPTPEPDPAATDLDADGKPKGDGVQTRINELTRKRHDAERDAAYWKGVAESKPATPAAAPAVKVKKAEDLNPDDYDSNSDYMKAFAKATREEIRSENAEENRKRELTVVQSEITASYAEGRKAHADFDAVALTQTFSVTEEMFAAARGPSLHKVLYFLGSNHSEAARISALPATQQIKEIGAIEAKLSTVKPKKTTTNAPDPPVTVGGGGNPAPKTDDKLSRSERFAKWEKERRAKAGVK